ncbi:MAG: hypothetical protein ABL958_09255 [Bdellovibrionia bacterium]
MKYFILIAAFFGTLSCSLDPYRGPTVDIKIEWPETASVRAGPSSYNVDCYFIDVNGSGIPKLFSPGSRYEILDLGLGSSWKSRAELAAGQTALTVRVPPGPARTIRIFGVNRTPDISNCASLTFEGHPSSGVFSDPPLPELYEIARATADLSGPATVATTETPTFATDVIAQNGVTLAGTLALYRSTTTTAPSFTDGIPPTTGGWLNVAGSPITTGTGLNARARLDLAVSGAGQSLSGYNIVNIHGTIEGGTVDCGSGALTARGDINLGVWIEGQTAWSTQLPLVTSTSQGAALNFNLKGIPVSTLATTVVPPAGATFPGVFISFRVKDAPAGAACTGIQLTQLGVDFYP